MMPPTNIVCLYCETESVDLGRFLKEAQDFKDTKYWVNPWKGGHAVALCSSSAEQLERQINRQGFKIKVKNEKETSSIIVETKDFECYGLRDKLKLLFQWKLVGGSDVKEVYVLKEPDCFEIQFQGGWEAVLKVCNKDWEMHEKDMRVTPYFYSFKGQNLDCPFSVDPNPSSSKMLEGGGTDRSQNQPFMSRTQGHNKDQIKSNLSQIEQNYTDKFYGKGYISRLNENEYWNYLIDLKTNHGAINQIIPFPNVWNYFTQSREGQSVMQNFESESAFLINDGQKERSCGKNLTVTILVTALIENVNVHLVQGSASDMNVDASFQFDDLEYESQPDMYHSVDKQFEKIRRQGISTLAISLSSKQSEKVPVDDFAKCFIDKLGEFCKRKSNMHIFLCETENRALFQAYKYFLSRYPNRQIYTKIDQEIWKEISPRDFSAEHLSRKVEAVQSINHTSSESCLVFLPISKNLKQSSCPYKVTDISSLENSLKYLHNNMTEEELDGFFVGSTHSMHCPSRMSVFLYCTQDWTFDVAKSIGYSLHACLKACSDKKFPDVYIYPPGVFHGSEQYPVSFTVQKCVAALMKERLEKINMLYLLVPETQYYNAFREMFESRTSSLHLYGWWNVGHQKFEYEPKSSVEIYGRKNKTEPALKTLTNMLNNKMKEYNVKREFLDEDAFKDFKHFVETQPPAYVHIKSNGKKVKISGLSKSAVKKFEDIAQKYFKRHHQNQPSHTRNSQQSTSIPTAAPTFKWKHLSANVDNSFSEKEIKTLEESFVKASNDKISLDKWEVDFASMTCVKNPNASVKTRGSKITDLLLRNEIIEGYNISKGKNVERSSDSENRKFISSLLSGENVNIDKIFKIMSDGQKNRFEYKRRSSSSLECQENLWHRVKNDCLTRIAIYGFQKSFSYGSQDYSIFFSADIGNFRLEDTDTASFILCDVLYDNLSVYKKVVRDSVDNCDIFLNANAMGDAHVLPKFAVKVIKF